MASLKWHPYTLTVVLKIRPYRLTILKIAAWRSNNRHEIGKHILRGRD